jgi:hypothetical protein
MASQLGNDLYYSNDVIIFLKKLLQYFEKGDITREILISEYNDTLKKNISIDKIINDILPVFYSNEKSTDVLEKCIEFLCDVYDPVTVRQKFLQITPKESKKDKYNTIILPLISKTIYEWKRKKMYSIKMFLDNRKGLPDIPLDAQRMVVQYAGAGTGASFRKSTRKSTRKAKKSVRKSSRKPARKSSRKVRKSARKFA